MSPYMIVQQMLQAAANTAPIGMYVCGHTSTMAGLIVSQLFSLLTNLYNLITCMPQVMFRN